MAGNLAVRQPRHKRRPIAGRAADRRSCRRLATGCPPRRTSCRTSRLEVPGSSGPRKLVIAAPWLPPDAVKSGTFDNGYASDGSARRWGGGGSGGRCCRGSRQACGLVRLLTPLLDHRRRSVVRSCCSKKSKQTSTTRPSPPPAGPALFVHRNLTPQPRVDRSRRDEMAIVGDSQLVVMTTRRGRPCSARQPAVRTPEHVTG